MESKVEIYDKARRVMLSCTKKQHVKMARRYITRAVCFVAGLEAKSKDPMNSDWSDNIRDLRWDLIVIQANLLENKKNENI